MSRLRRNIVYNLSGQLTLVLLSFVSARYIYRDLGQDVLGIIYFVMMLNNVVAGVLELGLGATVIKEVAAHVESDEAYARRVVRVGAFYFWCAFALVAGAQVLAAPWLVRAWLQVDTLPLEDATAIVRVLGPAAFLAFPKTFYTSVFRGMQRMGITNLIDVGTTAVQQVGVVALIAMGISLHWVVLWIAGSYVLRVTLYMLFLGRALSWVSLIPSYDAEVVRRNATFVRQVAGMSLLGLVQSQGDKLVMSKLLPVSVVGWYGFAYGTTSKGTQVSSSVATAVFPRLSELAHAKDEAGLAKAFHGVQTLMRFGLLPVFMGIPFVVPFVFSNVLDVEAMEALWLPTSVLALGFYMQGTMMVPHFLALGMERADIVFRQVLWALFLVFPLTAGLIYAFGIIGAPLGWLAYQVWAYLYGARHIYLQCLKISPRTFYLEVALSMGLGALAFGPPFLLLFTSLSFDLHWAALGYLSGLTLYAAGFWFLAGDAAREEVTSILSRLKARRRA